MEPCKFSFDDSPVFEGFSHGSTWNGFDNVAVTAGERERIAAYFRESSVSGDDAENGVADLMAIEPFHPNGYDGRDLYSLGWGYATQIVREPAPLPQAAELLIALRFIEVLQAWLTKDEWAEMRERNRLQVDPRICHSHDHCDANMAMAEAFESVTGHTPDGEDADTALWNKAWELAMPVLGRKV